MDNIRLTDAEVFKMNMEMDNSKRYEWYFTFYDEDRNNVLIMQGLVKDKTPDDFEAWLKDIVATVHKVTQINIVVYAGYRSPVSEKVFNDFYEALHQHSVDPNDYKEIHLHWYLTEPKITGLPK